MGVKHLPVKFQRKWKDLKQFETIQLGSECESGRRAPLLHVNILKKRARPINSTVCVASKELRYHK